MSVSVRVRAIPQPPITSIVTLTTEEAMRALFPKLVIDQAKQVAGASGEQRTSSIVGDASRVRAL
jgi:hypothetical protein